MLLSTSIPIIASVRNINNCFFPKRPTQQLSVVPVPRSTRELRLDQDSKSGESSNQQVISQIELNTIPVHISVRNERIFKFNQRSYKRQLIPVLRQDIKCANDNRNGSWLPSFHLINARSLHLLCFVNRSTLLLLLSHGYMMTLLQRKGSKSIETIDLIHVVGAFVLTYLLTFLVSEGMI